MGFFRNQDAYNTSYNIFDEQNTGYDSFSTFEESYNDFDVELMYEEHVLDFEEAKLELANGIIAYENKCFAEGMMTDEEIYTEGVVGSIMDKIKSLANKIKEFIKKLWTKFTIWFNGVFKSNSEFWKKYGKKIAIAASKLDGDWEVTIKFNCDEYDKLGGEVQQIFGVALNELEKGMTDSYQKRIRGEDDNLHDRISDVKEDFNDRLETLEDNIFDSTDYKASNVNISRMECALKNNRAIKDAEKLKTNAEKGLGRIVKCTSKKVTDSKGSAESTVELTGITAFQYLAGKALSLNVRAVKGFVSCQRTLATKVLSGAASADYKTKTEK